jgi:hypothetical protein
MKMATVDARCRPSPAVADRAYTMSTQTMIAGVDAVVALVNANL